MANLRLWNRCKGGIAENQPVTCTRLEGGPCSVCKEREAIREQIKQLEKEITKLKAKHHALRSRMNAIHDPFVDKLPPEIGSHVFCLCLPTFDIKDNHIWPKATTLLKVLRLGAVCRKWRQLAWATPDLWDTLYVRISPLMTRSVAESLPGLLHEWLGRSGICPLTIFFHHSGCPEESEDSLPSDDFSGESTVENLASAADLVIEIINLHSGRWRNLHLNVGANIPECLCGSTQPNQLLFLQLGIDGGRPPRPKFVMKSKPFPT